MRRGIPGSGKCNCDDATGEKYTVPRVAIDLDLT